MLKSAARSNIVCSYRKLHFAQLFFHPASKVRMVCSINAVLAGCMNLSFSAWWRLRVFFILVCLNKRWPVAKRIAVE